MPNVSQFRRPRAARSEPLFLFDARRPQQAATADMISQVITHADQCVRLAGGRLKLRVSAEMIETLQAQGRLAYGDYRLADLTVVWDEVEGEVVQACRNDMDRHLALLPFKMMIPLMLLIFPSLMILLFGPFLDALSKGFG